MRATDGRPYELQSVPAKPVTSGMGKPIPYTVQAKPLHQISTISRNAKRCGLFRCPDTVLTQ